MKQLKEARMKELTSGVAGTNDTSIMRQDITSDKHVTTDDSLQVIDSSKEIEMKIFSVPEPAHDTSATRLFERRTQASAPPPLEYLGSVSQENLATSTGQKHTRKKTRFKDHHLPSSGHNNLNLPVKNDGAVQLQLSSHISHLPSTDTSMCFHNSSLDKAEKLRTALPGEMYEQKSGCKKLEKIVSDDVRHNYLCSSCPRAERECHVGTRNVWQPGPPHADMLPAAGAGTCDHLSSGSTTLIKSQRIKKNISKINHFSDEENGSYTAHSTPRDMLYSPPNQGNMEDSRRFQGHSYNLSDSPNHLTAVDNPAIWAGCQNKNNEKGNRTRKDLDKPESPPANIHEGKAL